MHFDENQALIVMERLHPHVILRGQTMAGRKVEGLGQTMGRFCARTAFRGSDLSMEAARKKADVALFAGNVELCDITENLVFTDPYFAAELNRHTAPHLDPVVAELRADAGLKIAAQHMKRAFTAKAETLCHGDLHAGSIMVTDAAVRVIDPEFAFYGPMGFDIGMLVGNYLMAFHAMRAHIPDPAVRAAYQDWILDTARDTWAAFTEEFAHLWRTERTGILYPRTLYEDQGQEAASEMALREVLDEIFADLVAFAGIEMHRRILGLAHVAELDGIADPDLRAPIEARCLRLGRDLVLGRGRIEGIDAVLAMARDAERGGTA
jgi:5-methylthioribose kinase